MYCQTFSVPLTSAEVLKASLEDRQLQGKELTEERGRKEEELREEYRRDDETLR